MRREYRLNDDLKIGKLRESKQVFLIWQEKKGADSKKAQGDSCDSSWHLEEMQLCCKSSCIRQIHYKQMRIIVKLSASRSLIAPLHFVLCVFFQFQSINEYEPIIAYKLVLCGLLLNSTAMPTRIENFIMLWQTSFAVRKYWQWHGAIRYLLLKPTICDRVWTLIIIFLCTLELERF